MNVERHQADIDHRVDHTKDQEVQNTENPGEIMTGVIVGLEVVQEASLRRTDVRMKGRRKGLEIGLKDHHSGGPMIKLMSQVGGMIKLRILKNLFVLQVVGRIPRKIEVNRWSCQKPIDGTINHHCIDQEIQMKKRELILYVNTIKVLIVMWTQTVMPESIGREKDRVHRKIQIKTTNMNVFQARLILAEKGQHPVMKVVTVIQGKDE